jgi:hypothetical protein
MVVFKGLGNAVHRECQGLRQELESLLARTRQESSCKKAGMLGASDLQRPLFGSLRENEIVHTCASVDQLLLGAGIAVDSFEVEEDIAHICASKDITPISAQVLPISLGRLLDLSLESFSASLHVHLTVNHVGIPESALQQSTEIARSCQVRKRHQEL